MRSVLALPFFYAVAASQHHTVKWTPGQKVRTSSGVVSGKESDWQAGVSEYLGIPFAQPPVGDLRFASPKKFTGNATIDGTKFSPDCPANVRQTTSNDTNPAAGIINILGQAGDTFSEDCLTLNVWTKPQSGNPGKAVMVWIYGGGFTNGNSASPTYNGARLAEEEDVIVVSMNYRLNIFGFPGAPFLKNNNLGLMDQRMAVEWVRDNIKYFGGNPNRITLFGESAGAASVDFYSFAYTSDPIVSAFIPESGTTSISGSGSPTLNGASWYAASQQLGCGGESAANATLACIRSKGFNDVLQAINSISGGFGPVQDDKLVFGDYNARRKAGNFIKAPMLVGNNDNEGGLFNILGGKPGDSAPAYWDTVFTCPAAVAANARRAQDVPAWRYRYAGEFPNQYIGPKAGAWHGSEIGSVFGTTARLSGKANTPEQDKLSKAMRTAWGAFAKDPVHGLIKLGWPLYDQNKPTLIKLGGKNDGSVTFVEPSTYDGVCAYIPQS